MKAYFTRLINYDQFENHALLDLVINTGSPEKPVQLMAHLLAAQQIWLGRCKGLATISVLQPDWHADTLKQIIDDNHTGWIEYLQDLNPAEFEKQVNYKNTKGMAFENKLTDILAHVVNHGTHHRAQIGQQLKLAGVDQLPITDYIFYIREQ